MGLELFHEHGNICQRNKYILWRWALKGYVRYVNKPRGMQPCFPSSLHPNEQPCWLHRLTLQTLESFINQLWAESAAESLQQEAGKAKQTQENLTQFQVEGWKGPTRTMCLLQTGLLCPYVPLLSLTRTPFCPLDAPLPMFTLDMGSCESDASSKDWWWRGCRRLLAEAICRTGLSYRSGLSGMKDNRNRRGPKRHSKSIKGW